jgi:hypothetical protein
MTGFKCACVDIDTYHDCDSLLMGRGHQLFQIVLRSKVAVQLSEIPHPIPMISLSNLGDNRRNPHRIEAHALDVSKLLFNAFPGSSVDTHPYNMNSNVNNTTRKDGGKETEKENNDERWIPLIFGKITTIVDSGIICEPISQNL